MKKTIIKVSFVAIILVSLVVNFTQSKNTNMVDTSLLAMNMVAIANAEGFVQCNQPPRIACYIDPDDYTVLLGIRIQ
jgi:hypothetical protein